MANGRPHFDEVQTSMPIQREPSFAELMQRQRRVSFGSVFDAPSEPNEGGQNNEEKLNDWGEPLDDGDIQNQQNNALFKLKSNRRIPLCFMDGQQKMFQRGSPRSQISYI